MVLKNIKREYILKAIEKVRKIGIQKKAQGSFFRDVTHDFKLL
jgi:hypothetical protein